MIQKSMIMPLISSICLLIQVSLHQYISPEVQDAIATVLVNLFLAGFTIYGIFKNHDQNTQQKG